MHTDLGRSFELENDICGLLETLILQNQRSHLQNDIRFPHQFPHRVQCGVKYLSWHVQRLFFRNRTRQPIPQFLFVQ